MASEDTTGRSKNKMDSPSQYKKQMPKRLRMPPKKGRFLETDLVSPKDEHQGLFAFVTFEDGYTAKILKVSDILAKDENHIASFKDLKPGKEVLARWSDNKFYNAKVDYIGTADQTMNTKMSTKKDPKKRDACAQRFYDHLSQPKEGQSSSHQQYADDMHQLHQATQPLYHPPPNQLPGQYSTTPPSVPLCSSYYPQSQLPQTVQSVPSDLSRQPCFVDLDNQWKPTTANGPTAKESFLDMLYSAKVPERPSVEKGTSRTSEVEICSSSSLSSGDAYILEQDPIPQYGKPCNQRTESEEGGTWRPCMACKPEVEKLMEEKRQLTDVLCSIGGEQIASLRSFLDRVEQVASLRSFLDRVEQVLPQGGSGSTKKAFGKQELYPESGLFLSSTHLAAIHSEARKDCLRLFHLLFDEFFSPEDCQNAVAFGKHGKVPEGKRVLDKSRVNGILTYVMRCGTLAGWTPVEKTKVKKALINKCRMRAKNT